jgi:hypothetical protein
VQPPHLLLWNGFASAVQELQLKSNDRPDPHW